MAGRLVGWLVAWLVSAALAGLCCTGWVAAEQAKGGKQRERGEKGDATGRV